MFRRIVALLFLMPVAALAADPPGSETILRRTTVAGELTVTRLGDDVASGPYRIALGDRVVVETTDEKPADGMPIPAILGAYRDIAPYDEVVVLQQNSMGNACNGGPIWFLGLKKAGAFARSDLIDFCGGADPVIKREAGRLVVTLPGGPPNRGTGRLPTERWAYEGGAVKRLK